jgi:hypothetical protein
MITYTYQCDFEKKFEQRRIKTLLMLQPHRWFRLNGTKEDYSIVYHTDANGQILIFSEGSAADVDADLAALESHDGKYPMLPQDRT